MSQFIILCFFSSLFLQFEAVFSASAQHLCHLDEALSLLQFKKEMLHINSSSSSSVCEYHGRYSHPKMISWNESSLDCCTWNGITCHEITGHVIGLDLSCSRLKGVIHQNSTLYRLSYLSKLNLSYNNFDTTKISPNIGGLLCLAHLNFSHSGFDGIIPSEFSHLSKLVLLDLSDNDELTFSPQDFVVLLRNLTHIRVLSLYYTNVAASLQANWSSPSLVYLDLGYTGVHGKLPKSIFRLPRLQKLILVGNENLSVSLPESNHSSTPFLQVLDLSNTNLSSDGFADSISSFALLKSLRLSSCGLSGSLPNSIGNLSHLVLLDLSSNNFSRSFLSVISKLPKLADVDLSWNSFAGQYLSHIKNLTELTSLCLDHNLFSGPLLFNLSVLPKLRSLYLSQNAFNGTIPSWLFSSPSLTTLSLSDNFFTGQIKGFISPSIEVIDLSSNNLYGSIGFAMFSHLNKLRYLQLSYNKLSLKMENKTNICFPYLFFLGLSSCEITEFPSFLSNSKELQFLDLSNNKLLGPIHYTIGWNSLAYLNLSHNLLSDLESLNNLTVLGSLDTLPLIKSLEVLDLSSNKFQEQLPVSVCSFKELYILDLSHNNFTGAIPECYGSFSSGLEVLNLAKNDLKGAISMSFPKGNFLTNLNLNANLLEGTLPGSLANCEYLEVLDVGNNKINDTFPNFLGNLTELQVLMLKSNRFFGSLSSVQNENFLPKIRLLDLSCNEFTGTLPLEIFKCFKAMITMDQIEVEASYMGITRGHGNQLYRYPMSFIMKGQVVEFTLTSLVVIDLSSNNFTCEIPKNIGNLYSLIVLNLSHNNFYGHIPSTLGKLHFLECLDLSWNRFEGEIPWQLADLTSLEILNLSQNYLVGRIPQGKQFNTFLNDSYYGNLGLCGFPVTINCGESDLSLPQSQVSYQDHKHSSFWRAFTWKSVLIGYSFGTVFGFAIGRLLLFMGKPKWLLMTVEEVCCYSLLLFGE